MSAPDQIIADTANAVAAGVQQTVDTVSGLVSRVKPARSAGRKKGSIQNNDFPLTTSVETDFTMSDISAFGEGSTLGNSVLMKDSQVSHQGQQQQQQQQGEAVGQGVHKQSSTSKSSGGSNKSKESFTMSDLMGSHQSFGLSFGHSGRTRSFPDLMLSTGDLLPPLPAEEDGDKDSVVDGANDGEGKGEEEQQRSSSGRIMRTSFHRHSSSESSNHSMTSLTIRGFHPVRSRANTAMSGLNDAMSTMSIDSRKSMKSESSSWLDNFRSMQSIHSDIGGASLTRPMGDEGSVRSFLSDVSNDLNALDLAEPLLPPMNFNDSCEFMARPDP